MNKENSNEPGEKLVPREFEIPKLTIKEIKSITKLVFKPCKPLNADILFVLGSSAGDWKSIADLFHHKLVSKIIVTGLTGKYYDRTGIPLAHNIKTELVKNKVPPSSIIVQDRSTNTLEDIRFAKEELDKRNIFPKSILFASKSHHSGRVFLTLKKIFPDMKIYAFTYDAEYENVPVRAQDWWHNKIPVARVYGEYTRILMYSEKGDIAKP